MKSALCTYEFLFVIYFGTFLRSSGVVSCLILVLCSNMYLYFFFSFLFIFNTALRHFCFQMKINFRVLSLELFHSEVLPGVGKLKSLELLSKFIVKTNSKIITLPSPTACVFELVISLIVTFLIYHVNGCDI